MLIRRFEEKCGEMYTKGKIRGFLHLYTGQEACAVGAIGGARRPQDKIITHYRDHGHALARGLDPNRVMAELFGKATGVERRPRRLDAPLRRHEGLPRRLRHRRGPPARSPSASASPRR